MSQALKQLLEIHQEAIIEEGKSLLVSLEDGVCMIEKGLDSSPFLIKVDTVDIKFTMTIDAFLNTK